MRDVIETAPVDTRIDRLRVVMKQKMTTEVGNNVTMFSLEAARMAHERARLLGPVTPDRELTISELTLRADILSPFAFDVIWQTIIPRVKQKLAEHNDPSQS
ncbi:hypothetical protein ASG87_01465 [Frateuria sp. Soil773]|nr:hypothetical protein ASG87_01465 [Frateuria sp. Soil773]